MFKKILGGKGKKKSSHADESRELTIEDLITLERYEEAADALKRRVKLVKNDLHAHLKLAEVYTALAEPSKAIDAYGFVADSYAEDGFYDRAVAVLSKAARLAPGDDVLPRRLEKYKRMKRLEARRKLAIEGLLANPTTKVQDAANSALQMELLWNKIARTEIVHELSAEELKRLFSVMNMRDVEPGEILASAGMADGKLYLVVAGVVEAMVTIGSGDHARETSALSFSSGDVIGESVLLERKSWPAEYKVSKAGTVFELDRPGLEKAMQGSEDPVHFLSVLRRQRKDQAAVKNVQQIRG
ncbi:MAG: cyclic nucleotide-binding domain-containing protein [Acidobacteriota bacterium]